MKQWIAAGIVGLAGLSAAGCVDRTPPPPDSPVPQSRGGGAIRETDPIKPDARPDEVAAGNDRGDLPPPPFSDEPLVTQETPEQRAFVEAYNNVGRPRIVVFVNRTLDGTLLPVTEEDALPANDRPRNSGEVTVEARDRRRTDERDPFANDPLDARGSYNRGGGDQTERTDTYLRPGQYDEAAAARQIDYQAIESVLTDWIACGGKVEIISPVAARQRLTDEQVNDLQAGRPRVMGDLGRDLNADVIVQVSARPTRQTQQRGLELRLIAEAINVRGGQSVGRAVVDIPPPLDKPRIDRFTRYVARMLMDRMVGTWENMPLPREGSSGPRQPAGLLPEIPPAPGPAPAPAPDPAPAPMPVPPPPATTNNQ